MARLDTPQAHKYNVHMKQLEFQWDPKKNRKNIRKHGVSFEEAKTVFYDEYALQFFDPDHSDDEDRFLLLGISFKLRTIIACHCFREEETVVRIISAKKADKGETQDYWSERA